jgi:hypothetical protein
MRTTFLKGVVLGAIVAAVVSAGAIGFGAVTPFNLNTTANTVSVPTGASGSIAGDLFTLTDDSATAGAPLALTNNSTATGATALNLKVKTGKPPLTVNSATKVAKLNADKLDGIDSTGFVQGNGRTYTFAVAIARPTGAQDFEYVPSPEVAPGFFNVTLLCPSTTHDIRPNIKMYNLAGSNENVFFRNDYYFDSVPATLSTGNFIQFLTDTLGDLTTATVNGLPGGVQTTSSMQIATVRHANDCYFQIQALTTQQ